MSNTNKQSKSLRACYTFDQLKKYNNIDLLNNGNWDSSKKQQEKPFAIQMPNVDRKNMQPLQSDLSYNRYREVLLEHANNKRYNSEPNYGYNMNSQPSNNRCNRPNYGYDMNIQPSNNRCNQSPNNCYELNKKATNSRKCHFNDQMDQGQSHKVADSLQGLPSCAYEALGQFFFQKLLINNPCISPQAFDDPFENPHKTPTQITNNYYHTEDGSQMGKWKKKKKKKVIKKDLTESEDSCSSPVSAKECKKPNNRCCCVPCVCCYGCGNQEATSKEKQAASSDEDCTSSCSEVPIKPSSPSPILKPETSFAPSAQQPVPKPTLTERSTVDTMLEQTLTNTVNDCQDMLLSLLNEKLTSDECFLEQICENLINPKSRPQHASQSSFHEAHSSCHYNQSNNASGSLNCTDEYEETLKQIKIISELLTKVGKRLDRPDVIDADTAKVFQGLGSTIRKLRERLKECKCPGETTVETPLEVGKVTFTENSSDTNQSAVLSNNTNKPYTAISATDVSNEGFLWKKQLSKKQQSKENMSKENMSKEKMAKEKMAKEKMAKEKMAKEKMAKEKMAKEGLSKEGLSKEGLSKEGLSKERSLKKKRDHLENVRSETNELLEELRYLQDDTSAEVNLPDTTIGSLTDNMEKKKKDEDRWMTETKSETKNAHSGNRLKSTTSNTAANTSTRKSGGTTKKSSGTTRKSGGTTMKSSGTTKKNSGTTKKNSGTIKSDRSKSHAASKTVESSARSSSRDKTSFFMTSETPFHDDTSFVNLNREFKESDEEDGNEEGGDGEVGYKYFEKFERDQAEEDWCVQRIRMNNSLNPCQRWQQQGNRPCVSFVEMGEDAKARQKALEFVVKLQPKVACFAKQLQKRLKKKGGHCKPPFHAPMSRKTGYGVFAS